MTQLSFPARLIDRAHASSLAISIPAAILLPPFIIILFAILQKAQVHFFSGCLLTENQRFFGGLKKDQNYLQYLVKKWFNRDLEVSQTELIDKTIRYTVLTIVGLKLARLYIG
ncbi:MAG: hypothetical protein COT81_02285 [Candidatus Buchananbacteria bacterium CG10_big_fil_rev_8_21_14_0_10_42_9]|uniref:Uncharacterized protein n=1 Tax=Candidatus Buchananbacteria bacterium CG10_big_fil_rev_8_21_14_0_10_42_9 TaxID=1974526 RepID=A0A2H0W1P4_9BACT|nr:MAG: hypothetical protein COT81_02285 [Candidatus Buchananbacteria bacterium CG10_big_fil_rev_8_21_14_0_10_42_9]